MTATSVNLLSYPRRYLNHSLFSLIRFLVKMAITRLWRTCLVQKQMEVTDLPFKRCPNEKKTLPFSASIQHVKNVDLMLQCDECSMWRLLYSKFKLTRKERADLQVPIEDISFTCGAPLQNLKVPGRLSEVYTREISCGDPTEKL